MQILMFYKKYPQGFLKSEVAYWKHEGAWSTCQLPGSRKKENTLVPTTEKANLVQWIKEILFHTDRQTHTKTYMKYLFWMTNRPGKNLDLSSNKELYFTTALKIQNWGVKHRHPTLLIMCLCVMARLSLL